MSSVEEPKSKKVASSTWILLSSDVIFGPSCDNDRSCDVVQLRHPRTSKGAMFLLSEGNKQIQELFTFSESKSSWFINDTVVKDGKLYLSTPFDPLFIILPYFKTSCDEGKIMPLPDLLMDDGFPETNRLLNCCTEQQLNLISDRKGDVQLNAWKFNEDKTLSWLNQKVERVVQVLKDKKINVGYGAVSNTFVKSEKENNVSDSVELDHYLKYSFGLVSEYLPADLASKLSKLLELPEETKQESNQKRKSNPLTNQPKKIKQEVTEDNIKPEPIAEQKLVKSVSNKDKARAKSAAGSKNIRDFFKMK